MIESFSSDSYISIKPEHTMYFFYVLAFLLGDLYLQTFAKLPSCWTTMAVSILVLGFCWLAVRNKVLIWIMCGLCLGFTWTLFFAKYRLTWQLPKAWEGQWVKVVGEVASIPEIKPWGSKFLFHAQSAQFNNHNVVVGHLLQLTWPNAPSSLVLGKNYILHAKLKRIHATLNPGQFDYEAWAFQKDIRARGLVAKHKINQNVMTNKFFSLQEIRGRLYTKIKQILPESRTAIWLPALMIGEHVDVPKDFWGILRSTGTNHLMAIAGLHIGGIAAFAYLFFNGIARRISWLTTRMPASHAAHYAALTIAVMYSVIAGLSLPTQRACLMLGLFTVARVSKKQVDAWFVYANALFIILIFNPLAVLTESFWLSFGTIALILYCMRHRIKAHGLWWKYAHVQWVVGIGLLPISILFFQQCSIISFLANTLAIPWLTFFILPLCFLATVFILFSETIASYLLYLADKSMAALWQVLTYLATLSWVNFQYAFSNLFWFACTCIGIYLLLLPRGFFGKYLAALFFIPLFLITSSQPSPGVFKLALLDVGQGLAVVVRTENHLLIYDTGASYGEIDASTSVILPYLRQNRLSAVDALVISHADNDHIGGAASLLAHVYVRQIYASSFKKLSKINTRLCQPKHWVWDGVHFRFIYPTKDNFGLGNNSSCVLEIKNNFHRALLTGDIEKFAEAKILQSGQLLQSDILVAPHHGSKSSSTPNFLQVIAPKLVVFATGYDNRYGFPHATVMARYKALQAQLLNTANTGAIEMTIGKKIRYSIYRKFHQRYWHDNS